MRFLINSKPTEVDGHHCLTAKVVPTHLETVRLTGQRKVPKRSYVRT
jgi:hypothetical protein